MARQLILRHACGVVGLSCATLWLSACAPALDWRELRVPDVPLQALFPCKPSAQERRVRLVNQPVRMLLLACEAGGMTWGLAHADVGDPALTTAAQAEWLAAAAGNIKSAAVAGSPPARRQALLVSGATPHEASARALLVGQRPDGRAVQMQVGVFVYGSRVHQATVLGPVVSAEAADTFFSGLQFRP
jgi:hypothetical protein